MGKIITNKIKLIYPQHQIIMETREMYTIYNSHIKFIKIVISQYLEDA